MTRCRAYSCRAYTLLHFSKKIKDEPIGMGISLTSCPGGQTNRRFSIIEHGWRLNLPIRSRTRTVILCALINVLRSKPNIFHPVRTSVDYPRRMPQREQHFFRWHSSVYESHRYVWVRLFITETHPIVRYVFAKPTQRRADLKARVVRNSRVWEFSRR